MMLTSHAPLQAYRPSYSLLAFNYQDIFYKYYGLTAIELTVFLMQMKDTCAEGDGERNDINIKRLLMYFKSHGSFSKYAVEMFTNIAQKKALFSEKMAHRVRWGRFANWAGGKGKNIECDTAQEICNRTCKSVALGMGANKTSAAIVRGSKSAAGVKQIVTKFDVECKLHNQSTTHTSRSSQDDESIMMKDLTKLRPFHTSPGRFHDSFMNIEASPLVGMDMQNLFAWLDDYKRNIAMDQMTNTPSPNEANAVESNSRS